MYLKQLIQLAFISTKGIVETCLIGCAEHGIQWTHGIDQGAILVVCREDYQWRQVGKCADMVYVNGFSLLRQWRCMQLNGSNLPTCLYELETTDGLNVMLFYDVCIDSELQQCPRVCECRAIQTNSSAEASSLALLAMQLYCHKLAPAMHLAFYKSSISRIHSILRSTFYILLEETLIVQYVPAESAPPINMCWEQSGDEENIILVYKIHSSTPQSTPPTLHVLIAHLLTEVQCLIEGQDLPQVISDISVSAVFL